VSGRSTATTTLGLASEARQLALRDVIRRFSSIPHFSNTFSSPLVGEGRVGGVGAFNGNITLGLASEVRQLALRDVIPRFSSIPHFSKTFSSPLVGEGRVGGVGAFNGNNHPRTRVRGSPIRYCGCLLAIFNHPPPPKNLFLPPCGGGQGGGCRSVQRQQPPSDSRPRLPHSLLWMSFDDFQAYHLAARNPTWQWAAIGSPLPRLPGR